MPQASESLAKMANLAHALGSDGLKIPLGPSTTFGVRLSKTGSDRPFLLEPFQGGVDGQLPSFTSRPLLASISREMGTP